MESKRRILLICYEYPPLGGGGSGFVKDLLTNISERHKEYKIDLVTYGNNKFIKDKPPPLPNIEVHRVGSNLPRRNRATTSLLGLLLYPLFSIPKGLKLSRKHDYDLIYSIFVVPSGVTGIILSKILKKKHYLTVIAGDIYKPTKKYSPHKIPIFRWVIQYIISNSYKVNCISNDVKDKLLRFYKIRSKKDIKVDNIGTPLKLIPDPSELEKYTKFTFSALARLDSRKGYDLLIKAFSKLKNAEVSQLFIMGDGPELPRLEELVEDLDLNDRVKFLGFVSDREKYDVLARSHCFVLASYHEGFGLVYVEALQNQIPVVSTDNGGVRDIVKEGYNGLLSPIGDVVSLSNNMQKILDDEKLRMTLTLNSKMSVQKFDIDRVSDDYLKFLSESL